MVPVWAEGGTNESTALDGTSLVSVETVDTAAANQDFSITVELDADAASNGTQVGWTTQICINSGVCYAPETAALSPDSDGRLWTGSIVMDDESSYVNWRIELTWPDGNSSSVPETGFGWKVWSTCWYDVDSEQWGGDAALDDGCAGEPLGGEQEDEGWLPGFGGALAAASMAMAAFMARRD
tara:strand:+ start:1352 stop:1897 length:546 start_codon:yes stop_codon:yes gene_type:complete